MRNKEFVFEFPGTKDDLRKQIWDKSNAALYSKYGECYDDEGYKEQKQFSLDGYIIEFEDDKISFGVEGAHSGGMWFVPDITECDGRMVFKGKIQYIRRNITLPNKAKKRVFDKILECLKFIVIIPFAILFIVSVLVEEFYKRLRDKKKGKATTTEEKLVDLMVNYLECTQK